MRLRTLEMWTSRGPFTIRLCDPECLSTPDLQLLTLNQPLSQQIDIAVDLGVLLPPLAEILTVRQLVESAPSPPPQIVDGVLHQGCKGFGDTLHVWNLRGHNTDLTLLRPKLEDRLLRPLPLPSPPAGERGWGRGGPPLSTINYQLSTPYGLIILDPAYKVLGARDENANGDIASLMNELEGLVQRTGAALVVAHRFAKGDSTSKSVIDRMSGAGACPRCQRQ